MYFHTDDPTMIDFIARVSSLAVDHRQSLRIDVDEQGRLKVKRGEGMWTAPFDSTPDAYRDAPQARQTVEVETGNHTSVVFEI